MHSYFSLPFKSIRYVIDYRISFRKKYDDPLKLSLLWQWRQPHLTSPTNLIPVSPALNLILILMSKVYIGTTVDEEVALIIKPLSVDAPPFPGRNITWDTKWTMIMIPIGRVPTTAS